jgi:CRP/FNR family transcriptional regulator, cyclic AMP receptor protein
MSIVIAGWLAAALVFSSFFMKTMIPLRIVAIVSNVAFMTYALLGLKFGVFGRLYPILVLHASLLPLNVLRLRQITTLTRAVRGASDEKAVQALIPYMRTETRRRGDVLFRKGDAADTLYVIQKGSVLLPEIGKRISDGAVFGEVGLFAAEQRRALTAVCEEDCRLSSITCERVLELYYQNREFGFFLIRLVSGLVLENRDLRTSDEPTSPAAV